MNGHNTLVATIEKDFAIRLQMQGEYVTGFMYGDSKLFVRMIPLHYNRDYNQVRQVIADHLRIAQEPLHEDDFHGRLFGGQR